MKLILFHFFQKDLKEEENYSELALFDFLIYLVHSGVK